MKTLKDLCRLWLDDVESENVPVKHAIAIGFAAVVILISVCSLAEWILSL